MKYLLKISKDRIFARFLFSGWINGLAGVSAGANNKKDKNPKSQTIKEIELEKVTYFIKKQPPI